jgi:DNA ligase-1
VRLAELVRVSDEVAGTRSRSRKTDLVAGALARLGRGEAAVAAAFLAGRLRQGRVGVGPAAVRAAAAVRPADEPRLELLDVDRALEVVARTAGPGSSSERGRVLGKLFGAATGAEQSFLARLLLGELRQGALAGVLLDAVARATGLEPAAVRRAAMLAGDPNAVAEAALVGGRAGLERFRLIPGRPLAPMLASPADDLEDAMRRLGSAALEYKLDGARVQVHKLGPDVRVFSRRLHDVTDAVPELVSLVRALPGDTLVLDGEVLALRADGTPRPFQETMRRFGRRHDVERLAAQLPLTPFFFDLLLQDGEELIDRPAAERFARLAGIASDRVVEHTLVSDLTAAEAFYRGALERGHEGLVAKALGAPYAAGNRGFAWLKVKPAHTLDLVVLGVEWGSGRRAGLLSNLHLGARDAVGGGFVMLGKTFKGMTDEMLAWQTRRLLELETGRDAWTVRVRPELVVEVAFGDVQRSPHYPSGMALRFARVKRYREDKSPAEADTLDTVRRILDAAERG